MIFVKLIMIIVGIVYDIFMFWIGININVIMLKRWDLFYFKVILEREKKWEYVMF